MNLYREKTHEVVELPAELENHRGEKWRVIGLRDYPSPGRSGRVEATRGGGTIRTLYPQVFGCYIADEPRETDAGVNGGGPA